MDQDDNGERLKDARGMDTFYLEDQGLYPRRDSIWTGFWRMIWYLQRRKGKGQTGGGTEHAKTWSTNINRILTWIPSVKPNTNIPFIED